MDIDYEQLTRITPYMFDVKCKGFTDKLDIEEVNFQRLAYTIYKIEHGDKGKLSMDDVWRLRSDKSKVNAKAGMVKSRSMATLAAFEKMTKPKE